MSNKNLSLYKEILVPIIKEIIPSATIYLFGSRARNTNQEGADIDIVIDTGTIIDPRLFFEIQSKIAESPLPAFVDIVDFQAVSEEFKKSVLSEMVLWKK